MTANNFSRRGFLGGLAAIAGSAVGTRIARKSWIGDAFAGPAPAEPTSLVMVQLGGGYNSIFGSADSLVGKFGTTANTYEMIAGGVGFDKAMSSAFSPMARKHVAVHDRERGVPGGAVTCAQITTTSPFASATVTAWTPGRVSPRSVRESPLAALRFLAACAASDTASVPRIADTNMSRSSRAVGRAAGLFAKAAPTRTPLASAIGRAFSAACSTRRLHGFLGRCSCAARSTSSDAVASLRDGAYDYVTKPFDPEEFSLRVIGHIAEHRALRQELEEARQMVASRDAGAPIIGHTPGMQQLIERINTVAHSDAPVLIRGESGTGKELVAHTLHARSPRKSAPFVAVNCAAFPASLIEAELFGHERAASAGAVPRPEGRFQAADGGTLLLDEVEDLPLPVQAKLLRVLEEGVIASPGTSTAVPVNVRIVSATRRDLKALIVEGKFREDLYFRINVLDLSIPPLRERRADMPLLMAHFLRRFFPGRVPPGIAPRAWAVLMEYPFPGNVRELAHAVERAVVLCHGSEIDLEHLPADIVGPALPSTPSDASFRPLGVAMKEFEKQYLQRALRLATGGKGHVAELLGISRKNLGEKLKAYGLSTEEEGQPSSREGR